MSGRQRTYRGAGDNAYIYILDCMYNKLDSLASAIVVVAHFAATVARLSTLCSSALLCSSDLLYDALTSISHTRPYFARLLVGAAGILSS